MRRSDNVIKEKDVFRSNHADYGRKQCDEVPPRVTCDHPSTATPLLLAVANARSRSFVIGRDPLVWIYDDVVECHSKNQQYCGKNPGTREEPRVVAKSGVCTWYEQYPLKRKIQSNTCTQRAVLQVRLVRSGKSNRTFIF